MSTLYPKDSKIIVALDFDRINAAKALVARLDPALCNLKVGKEMFTHFGPDWVKYLVDQDFQVFLDLKFHDIPSTVANACCAAADLGVWMVNVHIGGGVEMMEAAKTALKAFGDRAPLLIGVTVLTSMNDEQYAYLGFQRSMQEQVLHFAKLAKLSGLDGVVCSAQEAATLSQEFGGSFLKVTPGIRPASANIDDQSRVMTPEDAIGAGADYLVIGRPITQSSDPLKALCEISESIVGL